jgi:hypothetical protein
MAEGSDSEFREVGGTGEGDGEEDEAEAGLHHARRKAGRAQR